MEKQRSYSIREIFLTLQGEGARSGTKAVFVRFAGCNLWDGVGEHRGRFQSACAKWCDTDFAHGERMTAADLLHRMNKLWPGGADQRWCVLTGGEPSLQANAEFVTFLQKDGWMVAMESNGTTDSDVFDSIDWLTLSPKAGTEMKRRRADELKVIHPGGWTEEEILRLSKEGAYRHLFIQPLDCEDKAGALKACIDFVMKNPRWRLGLQTHKLCGLP